MGNSCQQNSTVFNQTKSGENSELIEGHGIKSLKSVSPPVKQHHLHPIARSKDKVIEDVEFLTLENEIKLQMMETFVTPLKNRLTPPLAK
jgi:hypothetical protein